MHQTPLRKTNELLPELQKSKKKINSTAATRKQEREFNHHWYAGSVLSLT